MKLNDKGLLVVISGPSGVGKSTVRKALFNLPESTNLVYSISSTTRSPRVGEVDGSDYYFTTKEKFEKGIQENKFLEFAYFFGNFYGTPKDKVEEQMAKGKEVILEIEVEGAMQIKQKIKDAVFIFLVPPTKKNLLERIKNRSTESEAAIKERLNKAENEFKLAYKYDYIVVNDEINNAADRIMAIIRAEHAKTERSIHKYTEMIGNEK